jgi:hypothetical protein
MILAPTLTLNTLARGYDADATAFAAASGATDVAALSAFVKGVKELGLWSNMVCWPLRSSQNAGTGTTAYSLGGLGTFNGTLTNGPTWGADGIASDNDTKGILHDAGRDFGTGQFTIGACLKQQTFGSSCFALGLYPQSASLAAYDLGLNTTGVVDVLIRNNSTVGGFSRVTAGQMTADTFGLAIATRSDNTLVSTLNGNTTGTSSALAAGVNFSRTDIQAVVVGRQITGSQPRNLFTESFAFIIKGQAITASSFYTLYKDTLGQGLGLP